jgi:hypothetical protein
MASTQNYINFWNVNFIKNNIFGGLVKENKKIFWNIIDYFIFQNESFKM